MVHCRRPLALPSFVAVAALSLVAAGCGGGSSPGVAAVASSTTAATTTTTAHGSPQSQALAFARCMRSHGIPGWPDPTSRGFFDKSKLRALPVSVTQVRTLEDGPCNHLLNAGGSQGPPITLADRADYLAAVACMRSHGFPSFPDPTFQGNSVQSDVPSTIDQDSSTFRRAATVCTRLIPAGLPYSAGGRS